MICIYSKYHLIGRLILFFILLQRSLPHTSYQPSIDLTEISFNKLASLDLSTALLASHILSTGKVFVYYQ